MVYPDYGRVMKGTTWIFSTEGDPHATVINFMARWISDDSSVIETMTYKTTYKDVGLTRFNEDEAITFHGPSWHSGETLETNDPQGNKRKPTSSA